MKLSPTLDLSGATGPFENIQPTPSFYEERSSTPTTQELSVCYIYNCFIHHCQSIFKIILIVGICRYG